MGATEGALLESAGFIAVLGLIIWLVKRVFTHTIPRLANDFKEALKEQQDLFVKQLHLQRQDFREGLDQQRQDFREALKEDREALGRKLDRLTEAVESLLLERRK